MNMKSIFLLLFGFLVIGSINAQSEEYLNKVADQGCQCLKGKDLSGKDINVIQEQMGMCLMNSIMSDMENFTKQFEVNPTDQSSMQKAGEKIGFRMASRCPEVMMSLSSTTTTTTTTTQVAPAAENSISGKLTEINDGEFAQISVSSEDGSLTKLLWLEAFAGDSKLKGKSMIGKIVTVSYEVRKIWSPSSESYISRKVITAVR